MLIKRATWPSPVFPQCSLLPSASARCKALWETNHHQLDVNMSTFTASGKFIRKDLELVYLVITKERDNLSELPMFSICI